MSDVSPLAPKGFPAMPAINGVRLAAGEAGVKYAGRVDVLLADMVAGTRLAGVFTQSACASAPVDWCKKNLPRGTARGLVVNSGNANAFTGAAGMAAVERTARAAAGILNCAADDIYLSSTGVIGEVLPDEKVTAILDRLAGRLNPGDWQGAARAIMTTDTFPKGATATADIGGVTVTINGIAKGSGMIAPDMATMLGYVFTDAALPAPVLQSLLKGAADKSFNAVTVDSDTSTSDTVLLFATGKAGNPVFDRAADPALRPFRKALEAVCLDLAKQLVRDGEGASKFVTIEVGGAASSRAARKIAFAIANSPLVKTAIAGEDANWGRIIMAVGKAGEKADRDKLWIAMGGITVANNGAAVPGYDEAPVAEHMKGDEILIQVNAGVGRGKSTVWTCDLTHKYIEINADYRS